MTPTDAQIKSILKLAQKHAADCKGYTDFKDSCSFAVLSKEYEQEPTDGKVDRNITIVITEIYSFDHNARPLTYTKNYLVETDGKIVDMSHFLTTEEQAEYISTLTKLEMN